MGDGDMSTEGDNIIRMRKVMRHSVDFHQAANIMANGHLGGFAESLALTWFRADPANREKIQANWADLFVNAFEIFELRDKK
jgi:hypothetical protein